MSGKSKKKGGSATGAIPSTIASGAATAAATAASATTNDSKTLAAKPANGGTTTDRGLGRLSKWTGKSVEDFATLLTTFPRVVVMFSGDFCGPCKPIAVQLDALAKAHPGIHFVKLETTASAKETDPVTQLFDAYDVSSVPTLKLFRDSLQVSQWDDEQPLGDWVTGKLHGGKK